MHLPEKVLIMRYAEDTKTSVEKTRIEVERTLSRFGASRFMYAYEETAAVIAFQFQDKQIKFRLSLPDRTEKQFLYTPSRRTRRSDEAAFRNANKLAGSVGGMFGIFLKTHQFGRHVYAVGDDAEAARLNGIPVHRVTIIAYAVAGLLAALAGILLTARTGTGDPLAGEPLTLASITPVVVGGTRIGGGSGGLFGTFLGVLVVSFLSNALNYIHVSAQIQWVVQGLLIILAVIFLAEKENRR